MCLQFELAPFCLEVNMINARRLSVSPPRVSLLSCKSAYPTTYYTVSPACSTDTLIQYVQRNSSSQPPSAPHTIVSYFSFLLIIVKPLPKITCLDIMFGFCHLKCYTHQSITSPKTTHFLHPHSCPSRRDHCHSSINFLRLSICLPLLIHYHQSDLSF